MKHTIHNLVQGAPEWSAHRAGCYNASDLSAAMGISSYKTRNKLLGEIATGLTDEIDADTQRRFNDGHRFEALARPIAEQIIGEDLYPMTVSKAVDGLRRPISASLDGTTDDDRINFEHKTLNASLTAALDNGVIPDEYHPQMEQGMLINGATRTLFMASKWEKAPGYAEEPGRIYGMAHDEYGDICRYVLTDEKHCWYESNPALRAKIIPTWALVQCDADRYAPAAIVEKPKADVVIDLPALFVHAKGEITEHNMDAFGTALTARLAEVRAIVLVTDQDFSNAKEAAKKFRETAKAIALSKEQMLAQTETIGEAARKMDAWAKDLNTTALQLEKDVEREDRAKKESMINAAALSFRDYIDGLENDTRPIKINVSRPDFAAAIKGKRNYASMQDAVDTMLANSKIAADQQAADLRTKLSWVDANAAEYRALLADLQQLVAKPLDDFTLVVTARIDAHNKAEDARLEAERERIRKEEADKLLAEQQAQQEGAAAPQTQTPQDGPHSNVASGPAPAGTAAFSGIARAPAVQARQPEQSGPPTLRLGQINERLSPIALTADGLASLGFAPAATDKTAKLYHERDFPQICAALVRHIEAVMRADQPVQVATTNTERTDMAKNHTAPAPYDEEPYAPIPMTPVTSNQIRAIGYDEATKTLAVTFTRGNGAIYHYPNVEPKVYADFIAAESIGSFFGKHIKALPFKKFRAPEEAAA